MDVPRARSRFHRRRLAALVLLALGVLVPGITVALGRLGHAAPAVARREVWTGRVQRGAVLRAVSGSGTFVPQEVHWLSAPAAARVARIAVRAGGAVAPDTVVVALENAELELAALEAEHQAASAEAELARLALELRNQQFTQQALVADLRSQLAPAERHAAAANAMAARALIADLERHEAVGRAAGLTDRLAVETAHLASARDGGRTALAAAREQLARLREIARFRRQRLAALAVRAGIDGVVTEMPLEIGQWVALGAPLGRVARPDRLKVELRVAEAVAEDVRRGQPVAIESAAGPCRGHVTRVDPAVQAGAVRVEVALDDGAAPAGARPDLTVTASVELETLRDVLYIARPAGARDGERVGLYRLEADGVHAARVTVGLGRGSAQQVEVTSGLREGDQVVLSDTSAWDGHPRVRLQ